MGHIQTILARLKETYQYTSRNLKQIHFKNDFFIIFCYAQSSVITLVTGTPFFINSVLNELIIRGGPEMK